MDKDLEYAMEEIASSLSYGEAKVSVVRLGYRLGRNKAFETKPKKTSELWKKEIKAEFEKRAFEKTLLSSPLENTKNVLIRLSTSCTNPRYYHFHWPWFFSGWLSGYTSTYFEKKFIFHPSSIPNARVSSYLFEGREENDWKAMGEEYITDYEFFHGSKFVARSLSMRTFLERICIVAPSELPVYLEARYEDSPTFFAQYLHFHSSRTTAPFIHFETSRLDEQLFKSAIRTSANGTLYISSIELLPLSFQEHLMQALEKKDKTPRLIIHGENSLDSYVKEKRILPDLADTLKGSSIFMPEISKRVEDIVFYSKYYLKRTAPIDKIRSLEFSPAVFSEFIHHEWKGGVHELEATIRAMLVKKGEKGDTLEIEHLPTYFHKKHSPTLRPDFLEGGESLKSIEKKAIEFTLKKVQGNKVEAAKTLNIAYNTLWRKLNSYKDKENLH